MAGADEGELSEDESSDEEFGAKKGKAIHPLPMCMHIHNTHVDLSIDIMYIYAHICPQKKTSRKPKHADTKPTLNVCLHARVMRPRMRAGTCTGTHTRSLARMRACTHAHSPAHT